MRNLEPSFSLQVREKNGLLRFDSGIRPCHSFTKQFAQLMFNIWPFCVSPVAPVAMTEVDGGSITSIDAGNTGTNDVGFTVTASTGVTQGGVIVGTGTGAESINDTALGTQISHGTSAGNLQYGTVTFAAPSTTATTTTFRVTRVFTNGSGGAVTVQEIGLIAAGTNPTIMAAFLLIRDLTGAVTVNNGQQLTVNYDLTTTI